MFLHMVVHRHGGCVVVVYCGHLYGGCLCNSLHVIRTFLYAAIVSKPIAYPCTCKTVGFLSTTSRFKLLYCTLCRCVDYAVKIRVNPSGTGIDTNVKHSMVSVEHLSQIFI